VGEGTDSNCDAVYVDGVEAIATSPVHASVPDYNEEAEVGTNTYTEKRVLKEVGEVDTMNVDHDSGNVQVMVPAMHASVTVPNENNCYGLRAHLGIDLSVGMMMVNWNALHNDIHVRRMVVEEYGGKIVGY
jgi:hypothetical protein